MNGVDPSLASEDVVTGQDMGVGTPFMSQTFVYLPPYFSHVRVSTLPRE